MTEADWAELPYDILDLIAKRLPFLPDHIRFGAVCKWWRFVANANPRPPNLEFPWLTLCHRRTLHNTTKQALYSPIEAKLHLIDIPNRCQRCIGSSDGWLAFVDDSLSFHLFNPLSREAIDHLPNLSWTANPNSEMNLSHLNLRKAIWSKNPRHPDFIIVILCEQFFFFPFIYWKQGEKRWTMVRPSDSVVSDAIFYKEKLYFVNGFSGDVVVMDLLHQEKEMVMMPLLEDFDAQRYKNKYLAIGPSGLLFIGRRCVLQDKMEFRDGEACVTVSYKTTMFEVFELDEGVMRWARTRSLRGGMLFLGLNTSMWIASQGWEGCKEDSIYFTDDNCNWHIFRSLVRVDEPAVLSRVYGYDLGVFSLEDGVIKSIFNDRGLMYPFLVWVVPNPW